MLDESPLEERVKKLEETLDAHERLLASYELVRVDMQRQGIGQKYLRKENRALGGGLAGLFFVGWILNRVEVTPVTVVGLVAGLLGAIAVFYNQLQRGERKAKNSIAPPPP